MQFIPDLEMMLFERSSEGACAVLHHGISNFMLDWEFMGKVNRQEGFDTEIAPCDAKSLAAVAATPGALVWCRINRYGPHTASEIECAVAASAYGIFLPMVNSPKEVEGFLQHIRGRCKVGILVETQAALNCVRELATFALDRVYFGLNDFAISRGGGSIFNALLDGSVECAREAFAETAFGFGGVTAVDAGSPLPCARLIEEMARLDCQFTFLRRSYRRDVERVGVAGLLDGVRTHWRYCLARSDHEVQRDRRALVWVLQEVCGDV